MGAEWRAVGGTERGGTQEGREGGSEAGSGEQRCWQLTFPVVCPWQKGTLGCREGARFWLGCPFQVAFFQNLAELALLLGQRQLGITAVREL